MLRSQAQAIRLMFATRNIKSGIVMMLEADLSTSMIGHITELQAIMWECVRRLKRTPTAGSTILMFSGYSGRSGPNEDGHPMVQFIPPMFVNDITPDLELDAKGMPILDDKGNPATGSPLKVTTLGEAIVKNCVAKGDTPLYHVACVGMDNIIALDHEIRSDGETRAMTVKYIWQNLTDGGNKTLAYYETVDDVTEAVTRVRMQELDAVLIASGAYGAASLEDTMGKAGMVCADLGDDPRRFADLVIMSIVADSAELTSVGLADALSG